MKMLKNIFEMLGRVHERLDHIEQVTCDKAVQLEQDKTRLNSQLIVKTNVIEQLTEERDRLRSDNERLRRDLHALDGRLRHLLQSKTISLFDQVDDRGNYKRDIKRLDTYGVHYKIKEYETKETGTPRPEEALVAPGGQLITFSDDGESVKIKSLLDDYEVIVARDYIDAIYPDGDKMRFRRPQEMGQ